MLNIAPGTRIFLATGPTDMRKSFDGLFAVVQTIIEQDPFAGHLFLFRNRNRDRVKIMYWDNDGIAIWYKRLEKGSYQFPTDLIDRDRRPTRCEIRADELTLLLGGIDLQSVKRRKRYQRQSA